METGGWSLGADKAATQLIGRPSKYLTSVKNFNMNYPRKQGNTQPCGNYESAFWPILKVHNFYMSVSLKIQTMFTFLNDAMFFTMRCFPILNDAIFRRFLEKNIDLDVFDDV